MQDVTFTTLDAALAEVAARSFGEDCIIEPNDDHTFTVRDDFYSLPEDIEWTYARGVDFMGAGHTVSEHSRVFESCESWDRAAHVRYSLPDACDALANGLLVSFAYGVAYDYESPCEGDCTEDDGCQCDRIAGWLVMARIWDESL